MLSHAGFFYGLVCVIVTMKLHFWSPQEELKLAMLRAFSLRQNIDEKWEIKWPHDFGSLTLDQGHECLRDKKVTTTHACVN